MYNVSIDSIKKVYPDFKPTFIDFVRFNQPIGTGLAADIVVLLNDKMIQVTDSSISLFKDAFGFLDVEQSLLASYPCKNKWVGTYCFSLESSKGESNES